MVEERRLKLTVQGVRTPVQATTRLPVVDILDTVASNTAFPRTPDPKTWGDASQTGYWTDHIGVITPGREMSRAIAEFIKDKHNAHEVIKNIVRAIRILHNSAKNGKYLEESKRY